jgi:hypothetical protein
MPSAQLDELVEDLCILGLEPRPGNADELLGVACGSAKSCMAVGDYVSSTCEVPLAEVWDGAAWTVVKTPNRPATGLGV